MTPLWPFNRKPLILVVEDDPGLRALMTELLEIEGYETQTADNGLEGVAAAESKKPQLILLDMMMPGMGGLETLKLLNMNPKTRGIPVLMVTGEQKGKYVDNAFSLGAVGYIIKPIKNQILLDKIRQTLEK